MSTQFDPLKKTSPELHRFWFMVSTERQWYDIIRECRSWFGKDWKSMSKVRRKLNSRAQGRPFYAVVPVWFDVPDARFATWISVKLSIQVLSDSKYLADK